MADKTPESSTNHLKKAKKDLDIVYKEELNTYVNEEINIITNKAENQSSRLSWETVDEITGRKNTPTRKIKANNPEERLKKWKDHFHKLLGQPPVIQELEINRVVQGTLPINTGDFAKEDCKSVLNPSLTEKQLDSMIFQ